MPKEKHCEECKHYFTDFGTIGCNKVTEEKFNKAYESDECNEWKSKAEYIKYLEETLLG